MVISAQYIHVMSHYLSLVIFRSGRLDLHSHKVREQRYTSGVFSHAASVLHVTDWVVILRYVWRILARCLGASCH
eukprot:6218729-Amphidinium_carterae.1